MAERSGQIVVAIPFDAQAFNQVWRNYTGAGGYFAANNIYVGWWCSMSSRAARSARSGRAVGGAG